MSDDKKYVVLVHIPEWDYTVESCEMSEYEATSVAETYAKLEGSGYDYVKFPSEAGDLIILNRYMLERCCVIVEEKGCM